MNNDVTPTLRLGPLRRRLLFFFAVSGFAGLVYESLWSRYLGLFLGHAAYAQTLVLTIFMGGMAVGAWLASRFSHRSRNLLRAYAVTEGVIGLVGLAFPPLFLAATSTAYDSWLPAVGNHLAGALLKYGLAGLLIFPPSVLLGATFPLMSGGLLRRHPDRPGESLALLYFTNSLGAAAGILLSGFFLIGEFGLPGTIRVAGVLNLLLAVAVWLTAPGRDKVPAGDTRTEATPSRETTAPFGRLLAVALLTGAASFIYEIGWIRMLSLVLGTATHSFELMLSAFLLGLAFGAYWMRRRVEHAPDRLHLLGTVQLAMGLAALSTLPLYGLLFDLMQHVIRGTSPTDAGYAMFLVASHGIAMVIMFPATFCAGMTLPLITHVLYASGKGETAIGAVYSANTTGAILGVLFAANVGMPLLGLKGLIMAGAAIDVLIGLAILWHLARRLEIGAVRARTSATVATFATLLAFGFVGFGLVLDPYKMASGVFRGGELYAPPEAQLVFQRDGKTASVSLLRFEDGLSIRTNGKSDGAINLDGGPPISDEVRAVLSAALPLAHRPESTTAAVIGIGTGLTTHTLLASDQLERVDTIEIEEQMVEASRHFSERTHGVWTDPRSVIVIDDARAYFSTRNRKYDLIVSEPSNPWVSGVASLFTAEFYRHVERYLNPGGVLAQWLQVYEIDSPLLASVLLALGETFDDYVIYSATDGDILIVAGDAATMARPLVDVFEMPGLARELGRIGVRTAADIELRRVGGKQALEPMLRSYLVPPNSDAQPILDLNAARARFTHSTADDLINIGASGIPVLALIEGRRSAHRQISYEGGRHLQLVELARRADYARRYYLDPERPEPIGIPVGLEKDLELSKLRGIDCIGADESDMWLHALSRVQQLINSFLGSRDAAKIWSRFLRAPCHASLAEADRRWLLLYAAVGRGDGEAMAKLADGIMASGRGLSPRLRQYLLSASLVGHLSTGQPDRAEAAWAKYGQAGDHDANPDLRALYALLRATSKPAP